jgi:uncharacterized protein (DUF1015 family)
VPTAEGLRRVPELQSLPSDYAGIVRPFDAYVVAPEAALKVVAPAYDALTPRERFRFAAAHPESYLNVIRSVEDFPEDLRPQAEELLRDNARRLRQLIERGRLLYNPQPGFYLYRLAVAGHAQVGVVAEVPVEAYEQGLVKRHEKTQQEREEKLTRYLEVVHASSSPICLTYRHHSEIDALVGDLVRSEPLIDFVAADGLEQSVWFVDDEASVRRLQELFAAVPALYLTDGHHRTAAASRYAATRRAANPRHTGDEAYGYMLAALFPDDQLRIQDYNRCVKDLNGHTPEGLLRALHEWFEVERLQCATPEAARPARRREMALRLAGAWYRLRVRPGAVPEDPLRSLDHSILQEHVLAPLLGIEDPRASRRVEYVPGPFGLSGLESRCRDGWDLAFAVHPTSIEELMRVADADEVMPPKSTWFDPKVRSGLFVRLR